MLADQQQLQQEEEDTSSSSLQGDADSGFESSKDFDRSEPVVHLLQDITTHPLLWSKVIWFLISETIL